MFSGAGGLSLGLKSAGFSVVGAIENDGLACETYRMNNPDTTLFNQDVRDLSPEEVAAILDISQGELDLIAGCPKTTLSSTHQLRCWSLHDVTGFTVEFH